MRKIIAVDIDLTVCNNAIGQQGMDWWSWMAARSLSIDTKFYDDLDNNCVKYDMCKYFTFKQGVDPYDYWRQTKLYSGMEPIKDSVRCLELLSEDYDIIFVTHSKAGHYQNKCDWVDQHFSFNKGIYATRSAKGYIRCDYFIDDRNKNLNAQISSINAIKYNTPYTQDEPLTRDVKVCDNWKEIYEYIRSKD